MPPLLAPRALVQISLVGVSGGLSWLSAGRWQAIMDPRESRGVGWGGGRCGMIGKALLKQPPPGFFTFLLFLRFHVSIFSSFRVDFGRRNPY